MSMLSKARNALLALACLAASLAAQERIFQPPASVSVEFPPDSPVTVVKADHRESRASARGGAIMVDLHMTLSLRNSARRALRGVTLMVLAQQVTPGGKASVAVPSLNVAPNETFPVKIDLRLLRPLTGKFGPAVRVLLDGVLFDDLSFFGPNQLNSRRTMLAWELEAQRDRRYLQAILENSGPDGLQKEILRLLSEQAKRPQFSVAVSRSGPPTAVETGRPVQFAFLDIPGSPVEPISGVAVLDGNQVRSPKLEILNRSPRPVRYFEIGWLLRDTEGRELLAASLPAQRSSALLASGRKELIQQTSSLIVTGPGGAVISLSGMTGFVSMVEFDDGAVWVPPREALSDVRLRRILGASPEQERLAELYRRRGLPALIDELRRF